MKFAKKIHLCTQCKKFVSSSDDLLMVEEGSSRAFCSERCIEDFYRPLVVYYKNLEKKLREDYKLPAEEFADALGSPDILESAFVKPDEIWCLQNDLKEEIYSFIARKEDYTIVILCLVYDYRPSFIFLTTATSDPRLIRDFQIGSKLKDISLFYEKAKEQTASLQIDQEVISILESKKSSLLASLLERRLPSDIPFEQFPVYQQFYQATLEQPDEIYRWKDEEGDELYSYIKVHEGGGVSFYYVVICVGKLTPQLLPVFSFPTLDPSLYKAYKKGSVVTGKLKN